MSLLGSVLTTIPKYFPSTLVKTVNLPANTNYLFGAFPHGIVAHGVQMNFALSQQFQQLFPGLERQIISLPTFFKFPILRESFLLNGKRFDLPIIIIIYYIYYILITIKKSFRDTCTYVNCSKKN